MSATVMTDSEWEDVTDSEEENKPVTLKKNRWYKPSRHRAKGKDSTPAVRAHTALPKHSHSQKLCAVIGSRVRVIGLVSATQHNGRLGCFDSVLESGRLKIVLEQVEGHLSSAGAQAGSAGELSLKRENVEVVCSLCGLDSDSPVGMIRCAVCGIAAWCSQKCKIADCKDGKHKVECAAACDDEKDAHDLDMTDGERETILKLHRLHDEENWRAEVAMKDEALAIVQAIWHTREGCRVALDVYADLGTAFRLLGQFDEAIECEEEVLRLCAQTGDKAAKSRALSNAGMCYSLKGKLALALSRFQLCLEVAQERGDRHAQGRAYGNIGVVLSKMSNFKEAADMHRKALCLARELGDFVAEGRALNNLGGIGASENAVDGERNDMTHTSPDTSPAAMAGLKQKEEQLLQAIRIARQAGNRNGERIALGNLANCYMVQRLPKQALKVLNKALIICREEPGELDGGRGLAETQLAIGTAHAFLSDYASAYRAYDAAAEIFEAQSLSELHLACLCNGGLMLTHMGFLKLAITGSMQALADAVMHAASGGAAAARADDHVARDRAAQASSFRGAITQYEKVVRLADAALGTLPAGESDRRLVLHKVNVLYELARLTFLLGEEDRAVELLEQHLDLVVGIGRGACEHCNQIRLAGSGSTALLTCKGCGVARYCDKQHQRDDWGRNGSGHKRMCPLLKRWRHVRKGKESKEACRPDLVAHLQGLRASAQEALRLPRAF